MHYLLPMLTSRHYRAPLSRQRQEVISHNRRLFTIWRRTFRFGNKEKNISIYVKNITQTFHLDWRFNENSFLWSSLVFRNNFSRSFVTWNENFQRYLKCEASWGELKLFSSFWLNMLSMCLIRLWHNSRHLHRAKERLFSANSLQKPHIERRPSEWFMKSRSHKIHHTSTALKFVADHIGEYERVMSQRVAFVAHIKS